MTLEQDNRTDGGGWRRRLRLPSPALAISLVALFVALGGTSYALSSLPANSVGSKQLKKNAVTTKKIKNGGVTAAKINPAGLTVPKAALAGGPVAWAAVGDAGGVLAGRRVSTSNVTRHTAFYCFKGLSFPFKSATVTPDYGIDEAPGIGAGVSAPVTTGDCGSGYQAEVATWNGSILQPAAFVIQFWN